MQNAHSQPEDITADMQLSYRALAFLMADDQLRDRFLALTGLTADALRASLDRQETCAAILEFFMGHDPDLLALADHLPCEPGLITAAYGRLAGLTDREQSI